MSMLALAWHDATGRIDLNQTSQDKLSWLENAVTISLFTDALANSDDELPDGGTDRRGFWGDIELPENESLGSKLWLLKREKITNAVLNKTHDYVLQALTWLITDNHLSAITVQVERDDLNRVNFQIKCQLPKGAWVTMIRSHQHGI